MNTWTCTRQGELYHHGIKGQKWGVRRFQNKDGSLTPAGRRRYDEPNVGRKTSESVTIDGQTFKVYGRNNKQYADKVAKKAKDIGATVSRESKTKEVKKYKIPENKSLHRLKLEEKYMKNGMTREEAEQAAAKRIRTEKFVAAAAVVTVASAVAYAKYKGYTSDKTIAANSEFQRVMRLSENSEIRNGRQYMSFDKKDKIKYKGLLADNFNKNIAREHEINTDVAKLRGLPISGIKKDSVYDVTVKNKDVIKIASEKRARDTFAKLYENDKEFRKVLNARIDLDGTMYSQNKLDGMVRKIRNGETLTKNDIHGKMYDLFNIMLADTSDKGNENAGRFYDALRKQGVNAIVDVNDRRYSGFKAKMPIITFDGEYDYSKRAMSDAEIEKNLKKATNMITIPELMKQGAILIGAYGSVPVMNKVQLDKKVLLYKQDHPNTTMTDKEIKAMIQEELQKGGENSK